MKKEFVIIKLNQCLSLFILSLFMVSAFSIVGTCANSSLDDFPVGLILEYEKEINDMSGVTNNKLSLRFEVINRLDGYDNRYIVVRTTIDDSEITNETFYQDYPNGNLTVHVSAPLWINLSSLENLSKVTFGWRVYNVTSYSNVGCSLHHLEGYDEDTIGYDSNGFFASGYFFHFNFDNPFGTYSISTKLVSSNANLLPISNPYGWVLTAVLLPALATEVVIIGALVKRRRIQVGEDQR